ncbi:hypothetical protein NDU88_006223 [Pleurodeles waltl]|uniref:Uncharacterized protein n=1 Tax=Pleurodeles waltl TaxID=8319 RepID=A0AAV7MBL2_PLEWA|nr:hypothetical protein NDU88_006223 [Pleurodeles waltl]
MFRGKSDRASPGPPLRSHGRRLSPGLSSADAAGLRFALLTPVGCCLTASVRCRGVSNLVPRHGGARAYSSRGLRYSESTAHGASEVRPRVGPRVSQVCSSLLLPGLWVFHFVLPLTAIPPVGAHSPGPPSTALGRPERVRSSVPISGLRCAVSLQSRSIQAVAGPGPPLHPSPRLRPRGQPQAQELADSAQDRAIESRQRSSAPG